MAVTIYYDGDCPFCERYVRLLRLRRAAGSVRLVDVRENADVRGGLEDDGFDLEMPEPLSRLDGPLVHYATIYDLLDHLQKNPDVVVTFRRGGQRFERVSAADLADDMAEMLHPVWFRKWFHFQPVALQQPESCNV